MEAQSDFTKDITIIIKGGLKCSKLPKQVSHVYDNTTDSI